jgi:hypothetical protein
VNSIRIDYDIHRNAQGKPVAQVSMLLWKTDYIPGHPDGEHGSHVRGQVFVSESPPKADKTVACTPGGLGTACLAARRELLDAPVIPTECARP